MADLDFDMRLSRLFAEDPALPDGDAFARRVEARLERDWTLRRVLIGGAGLVGGLVVAGQMLMPHVAQRIQSIPIPTAASLQHGMETLVPQWKVLSYLPYSSELLWIGAGLAALGVAALAKRSIEDY